MCIRDSYGTGALGDMACHILHQPFRALKLGYPTKVAGSSTLLLSACAPQAQHVTMIFPARDNMPKVALPEVEVHWYDGGMMPVSYTHLIKRMEISASHKLVLPYRSKCASLHGHNWIITVYCRSARLNADGMVVDFTSP